MRTKVRSFLIGRNSMNPSEEISAVETEFTPEQRRALADVYRFLLSLAHQSRPEQETAETLAIPPQPAAEPTNG